MSIETTNRSVNFDVLRIICTLWIVGVWHLFDYFPTRPHVYIGSNVTIITLASFAYISGYFLQKYKFSNKTNVWKFYKKRFWRFYVLYALSIITLCVGSMFTEKSWFASSTQLILSLVGLNAFYTPAPGTIWFMGMMMFFYLITPFIRWDKTCVWGGVLKTIMIYLILYAWSAISGNMDERMLLLYPMYMMGLYTPPATLEKAYTSKYKYIICLFVLAILFLVPYSEYLLVQIIMSICGIIVLLKFSTWISQFIPTRIITFLSFSSLCLYLFHRQVFEVFRLVFGKIGIEIGPFVAYVIMLPTAIIISYFLELLYDAVLRKTIERNHKQ